MSLIFTSGADAKPFANNFIEMNIPDSWECTLYAGEDWTCQPMDREKAKDVIIAMSFANQGGGDSLQEFYKYLQDSLMITDPATHKQHPSKPINMQYKDIMGQSWVDSQHLSTIVPNYLTRCLATIKDGRAVLITITVEKSKYSMYMSELYKTVESMKIRMTLPAAPMETGLKGLIGNQQGAIKNTERKGGVVAIAIQKSTGSWIWAAMFAVVAFILVFYIIKKRNKSRAAKKRGMLK
ncbi:MAG: hypothetical protein WCQ53_04490 [bacterium]